MAKNSGEAGGVSAEAPITNDTKVVDAKAEKIADAKKVLKNAKEKLSAAVDKFDNAEKQFSKGIQVAKNISDGLDSPDKEKFGKIGKKFGKGAYEFVEGAKEIKGVVKETNKIIKAASTLATDKVKKGVKENVNAYNEWAVSPEVQNHKIVKGVKKIPKVINKVKDVKEKASLEVKNIGIITKAVPKIIGEKIGKAVEKTFNKVVIDSYGKAPVSKAVPPPIPDRASKPPLSSPPPIPDRALKPQLSQEAPPIPSKLSTPPPPKMTIPSRSLPKPPQKADVEQQKWVSGKRPIPEALKVVAKEMGTKIEAAAKAKEEQMVAAKQSNVKKDASVSVGSHRAQNSGRAR